MGKSLSAYRRRRWNFFLNFQNSWPKKVKSFENFEKNFSDSKNNDVYRFRLNGSEKKLFKFQNATFSWDTLYYNCQIKISWVVAKTKKTQYIDTESCSKKLCHYSCIVTFHFANIWGPNCVAWSWDEGDITLSTLNGQGAVDTDVVELENGLLGGICTEGEISRRMRPKVRVYIISLPLKTDWKGGGIIELGRNDFICKKVCSWRL